MADLPVCRFPACFAEGEHEHASHEGMERFAPKPRNEQGKAVDQNPNPTPIAVTVRCDCGATFPGERFKPVTDEQGFVKGKCDTCLDKIEARLTERLQEWAKKAPIRPQETYKDAAPLRTPYKDSD